MSRSITIAGVERADLTRLESFSFQESAYRGEVGQGGFDVDSEAGAVSVNAWKDVVAIDSDGGQFFTGQTIDRGVGRGPYTTDSDAQWDVQVVDMNTIMDDILLRTSTWNRPEETDVERMQALVSYLNTQGYAIDDTYLLTANAEDMDEQDYRKQGVYPRSVADECAENSGKNWYLFWDDDIGSLSMWYGRESASDRTSAYGISSVLEDIDDYGVTWAAEWVEESGLQLDPSRVYSAVQVVYGERPSAVYVDRPATEAAFKRREAVLFDNSVKTETKATKLAQHYLDYAETEDKTITVAVTVPTTHVNAFLAGQRIALRAPHLGYDTPTFMRCRTRTVEPAGGETKAPGLYRVTLMLKPSVKVTRFGGRPINDVPGQGDGQGDGPPPAETEAGTSMLGSVVSWDVHQYHPPGGPVTDAATNSGVTMTAGSWVYYNHAYTSADFPCSIGPGSFSDWWDRTSWWQYTAAADGDWFGIRATIDATGLTTQGYVDQIRLMHYPGIPAAGMLWDGTGVGTAPASGTMDVFIPRSLIEPGATNAIGFVPSWLCVRPTQFCGGGGFTFPYVTGEGNSGQRFGWGLTDIVLVQLAAGQTSVQVVDMPGKGAVDGTNGTFELIAWNAEGAPSASINGIDVPVGEVVYDTALLTATITPPPPAGALVLFTYMATT